MSKAVSLPHRLQTGIEFEDSLSLLNDNFNYSETSFNGFSVIAQPNAIYTTIGTTVPAGGITLTQLPVYTNSGTDRSIAIKPQISLFIDSPKDGNGSYVLPVSPDYLFPTGSTITTDALKVLFSSYVGAVPITPADLSYFTFTDKGTTYYPCNYVNFVIRNAGSSSHDCLIQITASVYSSNTSQFR